MFSAFVVTISIMRGLVRLGWARKASLYGLRDDGVVARGAVRPAARRAARADG
jgi:hypothetical protein